MVGARGSLLLLACSLLASAVAASEGEDSKEPKPDDSNIVKPQLSTKIYQSTESFYVHGPGLGSSELPVFANLVVGVDVDLENENLKNRVKVTLKEGKQWGKPHETITVVKTTKDGVDVWVADDPVQVAFILADPAIDSNDDVLGESAKRLVLSGSGFEPKHTYLTFAPTELMASVDYNINNIEAGLVVLSLKADKSWGSQGDLKVVSVDTGAGPFPLDVKVATIVASDHPSQAVATITKSTDKIYMSRTRRIVVRGEGFVAEGQYVGFQGNCAEIETDFTVKFKSATELELKLKPGKEWCTSDFVDESPSGAVPLMVRSVLEGVLMDKAVQVATVLLDPEVEKNVGQDATLMASQSLTLELTGDGFVPGATVLVFDPPLVQGVDYELFVEDTAEVDVHLHEGKAWVQDGASFPATLKVLSVDTGAGPVELNGGAGVVVAKIIKGSPTAQAVTPSKQKVYNSVGRKWLVIHGEGFTQDPKMIELGPLECGTGVKGTHIGDNKINLTLSLSDDEWCSFGGPLYLRSMKFGKKTVSFVGKGKTVTSGVQIAYVLNDPDVEEDVNTVVYSSHTKTIVLDVDGVPHTDEVDVLVKLEPPHPDVFTHEVTLNDELVLRLKEGHHWTGDKDGKLHVAQINTGAGWVKIDSEIATVESDGQDTLCSNTCEWASDGTCDDEPDEYATDNMYDYDSDYFTSPCEWGTDCTDCGPREVATGAPTESPTVFDFSRCDDSCDEGKWANDGECDDSRSQSFSMVCDLGTDCSDCGPIPTNKNNSNVDLVDARMCVDGLYGNAVYGDRCVFPFTFEGVEHNECSHSSVQQAAVRGWCSTTADYDKDGLWGSCAFCYDVNAETNYYYDPSAQYYYEYRYAYEEFADDDGNAVKEKKKVQTKVQKTGVVDPHAGQRPSGSSVGGSVVGIFGLALVAGAAFYAYRKFVQATPSASAGGYSTVSNRDVELAGLPMRASATPITPDNFRS